ncbi:von Willebrand factor A domain-containing protein 5 [Microdochium nivale]|nr:von Willebrand factor A domain-containing protein 5 [Microdochium nivale]
MENYFQCGIQWDPREPLPEAVSLRRENDVPTSGKRHPLISQPHYPPQRPDAAAFARHLAPISVSFKGQVAQDLALLTVSQTFENTTADTIPEARYTFPLTDNGIVTAFSCRVGTSKILRAKVKPKIEARRNFDKAKQEGRFAGLLEGQVAEVFTASLGNIPTNVRVKTELSFTVQLRTSLLAGKTVHTLLIPIAIGPRYGTAPTIDAGHHDQPDRFSLDVDVLGAHEAAITSPSHELEVTFHARTREAQRIENLAEDIGSSPNTAQEDSNALRVAHIKLRDVSTFRNKDLRIEIHRERSSLTIEPQVWIEKHPTLEKQYALFLDMPPAAMPQPHIQQRQHGEVIFLADRSGSMQDKMDSMRVTLQFFLKGIPVGWKFNVWSFGTGHDSMWPESREYDAESLGEALSYLQRNFEANMGGTELLAVLESVVASRNMTATGMCSPCEVIIITDGEVWRLQDTLDFVAQTRVATQYTMRFFALGIGHHVSAALVDGIAQVGGGYSEIVPEARDGIAWQDKVVPMLKTALGTSIRHRLSFQLGHGARIQGQSPSDLIITNSLFESRQVYFLFTVASDCSPPDVIEVEIEPVDDAKAHQKHHFKLPTSSTPATPGTIHALAARACLTNQSAPPSHQSRPIEMTVMSPQELACSFSLLSKWTSLVLEAGASDKYVSNSESIGHDSVDNFRPTAIGDDSQRPCALYSARGLRSPQFVRTFDRHEHFLKRQSFGETMPNGGVDDFLYPRQHTKCSNKSFRLKKAEPNAAYIKRLMNAQSFDGSFRLKKERTSQQPKNAIDHLTFHLTWTIGPYDKPALPDSAILHPPYEVLATTAVVIIVLSRYYTNVQLLWLLMDTKARAYVDAVAPVCGISVKDLYAKTRELLDGNRVDGLGDLDYGNSFELPKPVASGHIQDPPPRKECVELEEAPY